MFQLSEPVGLGRDFKCESGFIWIKKKGLNSKKREGMDSWRLFNWRTGANARLYHAISFSYQLILISTVLFRCLT